MLNKAMKAVENKQQALVKRCTDMIKSGVKEDSIARIFQKVNQPIIQEMETTVGNFIRTHSNSEAAAVAVTFMPPQKMRETVALLSDNVKNGRMKPFYQQVIDSYEALSDENGDLPEA